MATADVSIFSGLLQPPKSVADYDMQAAQLQGVQQQNQTGALNYQIAQRNLDRSNQLLALSRNLPAGSTDLDRLAALRNAGFYDEADKLDTSMQNRVKTTADATKAYADAGATTSKSQNENRQIYLQAIPTFANTNDVKQFLANGVQMGKLSQADANQMIQQFPDSNINPKGFQDAKDRIIQSLMSPKDQTALTTPDANAKLNAATSTANNAATNAAHIQGANIGAGASMYNTRANIAKDYKINGLDANGNFDASAAGGMAPLISGIANYQIPESAALTRVPLPMRATVMAQVLQQNPSYSQADFNGVNKTIGSMANGPLGNAVRSNNVALTHLDTLSELTKAMGNGDYPLINKLSNLYQTQTGQTAPTNLAAARQLVMGEVANVVAAGGATLGDRETSAQAINSASSPQQFAEVIGKVIKPLMAGKLQGLEQQYLAGTNGRTDFRTKYLSPAARAQLDAIAPQAPGGAGAAGAADPLGLRR